MRQMLQALPLQLSCMFDTSMVDPELLSVLQMWQEAPRPMLRFEPQEVEYVPMSMFIPTKEVRTLHPAVIYAQPAMMDHLRDEDVERSKQCVDRKRVGEGKGV